MVDIAKYQKLAQGYKQKYLAKFGNILKFPPLPIFDMPKVFKDILIDIFYKYIVFKGGRGSTKTQSVISFLIEESFNLKFRGCSFVFLREIQKNIKDSIKSTIEDTINELRLPTGELLKDYFICTNDVIKNKLTGVEFIFRGARDNKGAGLQSRKANADKAKGLSKVAYVFADEASALSSFTLSILIPTPRKLQFTLLNGYTTLSADKESYKEARFIFCLNPVLAEDDVIVEVKELENAIIVHKNIFDIEEQFQSQELLDVAKSQEKKAEYSHVWLGTPSTELELSLFSQQDIKYEKIDLNYLDEIVIAIDPNTTNNAKSDEVGIVIAGRKGDTGYLIADISGRYSQAHWVQKVVGVYHQYWKAHIPISVVAEVNQGGDMVRTMINQIDSGIQVINVWASKGKHIRIEPISMLYKNEKIKHFQKFVNLERQLLMFTSKGYLGEGSPDRADANTWAFTHLMLKKGLEVW